MQRCLRRNWENHTRLKGQGRKIIMNEGLLPALEKDLTSPELVGQFIRSLRRVPRTFTRSSEIGYLLSTDFSGLVLKKDKSWYAFRQHVDMMSILEEVLQPDVLEVLRVTVPGYIAFISQASSKADTLPYSRPIQLAIIR